MSDIQLGLIGAGRWGRIYMNTLDHMADVALSALASSNPQSRDLVGEDVALHDLCPMPMPMTPYAYASGLCPVGC